jgi:hypothetical protein
MIDEVDGSMSSSYTIMENLYAEALQVEKQAIEILEEYRNH